MRLIVAKNGVGSWTAKYLREKLKNHNNEKFVLGLPTGGTALDMYKNIISMYQEKQISFKNVTTFNMDEYINLPKNHKESYWTYMHENLFNHIDIDTNNVNIPDGNAKDVKKECLLYEQKIKEAGGIDLFFGGVGINGHIAFNEPFSSLSSYTRDKELDKSTILANSRFFENDISQVPKSAITVGTNTLLESKEVIIMVTGANKSMALQQCIEGPVSHMWPVTILQKHNKALIIADEDACQDLKLRTFKYFTEMEDEYSYIDNIK